MGWNGENAAEGLCSLGNWVVRVVGSLIFLMLTWYAFRYTQYIWPGAYPETPELKADSLPLNLLCAAAAAGLLAFLMFLERRLDRKIQLVICRGSGVIMLLWIAAVSVWWIHSSSHVPVGDQAFIYGGASYFMDDFYDFLKVGGYCDMYPYQLGLIALCELFFRIVGPFNYYAFEILCMFLAVGSAWCGYGILAEIRGESIVMAGYNILMMGCLPLMFYTPWVYGDIPSIFFALLAAWMLLRYGRRGKLRYLVILVFALVLAMLVRKNSAILLMAAGIAIFLYALRWKDIKILVAFGLAVVLAAASYGAIYKMYEIRSGYEHSEGTPFIVWLAMGSQEINGTYGWDNNYYKAYYYESGCDKEATAEDAGNIFRERMEYFARNPSYAVFFYKRKIMSQWQLPTYQALYFNAEKPEKEGGPEEGSLAAKLNDAYYERFLAFCDRWQSVVYLGMLCYFLLAVKRDSNILQHILAITIIGGFLYSVISEAKARYIFPYYVMMFPFAVYGYQQAVSLAGAFIRKKRGEYNWK